MQIPLRPRKLQPFTLPRLNINDHREPLGPPYQSHTPNQVSSEGPSLNMDTNDVSEAKDAIGMLKHFQANAERAMRRKGQKPQDHSPRRELVSTFMLQLQALTDTIDASPNAVATTQVHPPYLPRVKSIEDLKPIMIKEMALKTHHRGRMIYLEVLTPPSCITAVTAIVGDGEGTAVLLQLYHQAEKPRVLLHEILWPGRVCILKEPFFKATTTDGTYGLRVDHDSDIIWLDKTDERMSPKWRTPMQGLGFSSHHLRLQGNAAVQRQDWTEAEHL